MFLNLFEMIFPFLLILQLALYNVQGKLFLVETEDENSLDYQVFENFLGPGGSLGTSASVL